MINENDAIIPDIQPPEPVSPEVIATLPRPIGLYHNSEHSYCGVCRTYTDNTPDGKCSICVDRQTELSPTVSDTSEDF
jgi:recombinational DNA repair protein RecR